MRQVLYILIAALLDSPGSCCREPGTSVPLCLAEDFLPAATARDAASLVARGDPSKVVAEAPAWSLGCFLRLAEASG